MFLTIKNLTNDQIKDSLIQLAYPEDLRIDFTNTKEILQKLNSKLNVNLISLNDIGYDIANDLNQNNLTLRKLIQWNHIISSLFKLMSLLNNTFEELVISEYWDNTFQIKINKKEDQNVSIGFLFGLVDSSKNSCNLTEYAIGQTSMEQIFNNFAHQEEFRHNNKSINHKPEIVINKDYLANKYASI